MLLQKMSMYQLHVGKLQSKTEMILIKKTAKYAINIYLDEDGVSYLLSRLINDSEISINSQSIGFNGKRINKLKVVISHNNSVKQSNAELRLEIDKDDLDYFKFKLNQYFVDFDFIPEELFSLENNRSTIHFYLTKVEYLENISALQKSK